MNLAHTDRTTNNRRLHLVERTFGKNIFSSYCSEESILLLNAKKQQLEFKVGEYIFREGEEVEGIYLIEEGAVKVVSRFGEQGEHILRLAGKGKLLGQQGLGAEHYTASAIALLPASVMFIPADVFNRLVQANPEFSLFLIHFIASELNEAESAIKKMMQLDVRQKTGDVIVMLIDSFGYKDVHPGKLAYTLSRRDFSNISGITYETVIRSLTYLQKAGLIGLEGKSIRLLDEPGLRNFCRYSIPASSAV
jgi:CRP-like cAMP-binding protein